MKHEISNLFTENTMKEDLILNKKNKKIPKIHLCSMLEKIQRKTFQESNSLIPFEYMKYSNNISFKPYLKEIRKFQEQSQPFYRVYYKMKNAFSVNRNILNSFIDKKAGLSIENLKKFRERERSLTKSKKESSKLIQKVFLTQGEKI